MVSEEIGQVAWNSNFQLRIVKGNQESLVIPLVEQSYVLGRAQRMGETAQGHIFFFEPTVSRTHAELKWNEKKKQFTISHRSNTNPTLVEGVPVGKKESRLLAPGQEIRMGHLIVHYEQQAVKQAVPEPVTPRAVPARGLNDPPAPGLGDRPAPRTDTSKVSAKEVRAAAREQPGLAVDSILAALGSLSDEKAAPRSRPTQPERGGAAGDWRRSSGGNPSVDMFVKAAPNPNKFQDDQDFLERPFDSPENSPLGFRLVVSDGPDCGKVFPVNEPVVIIGRAQSGASSNSGTILLNDPALAIEAATLTWQGRDGCYSILEGEHNTREIYVRRVVSGRRSEHRINPDRAFPLEEGDVLEIGQSKLVLRRGESSNATIGTAASSSSKLRSLGDLDPAEEAVGPPPVRGGLQRAQSAPSAVEFPRSGEGRPGGKQPFEFPTPEPRRKISLDKEAGDWRQSAVGGTSPAGLPRSSSRAVDQFAGSEHPTGKFSLDSVEDFPVANDDLPASASSPAAHKDPPKRGVGDVPGEVSPDAMTTVRSIRLQDHLNDSDTTSTRKVNSPFGRAAKPATETGDTSPPQWGRPATRPESQPPVDLASEQTIIPRSRPQANTPDRGFERPDDRGPSGEDKPSASLLPPVFMAKTRQQPTGNPKIDHSDAPTSPGVLGTWSQPAEEPIDPRQSMTVPVVNRTPPASDRRESEFPNFLKSPRPPESEQKGPEVSEGQRKMVTDVAPLNWPWKKASDFIFDFIAGPSQGCQLPFSQADLNDNSTVTLGNLPGRNFDLQVEGEQSLSAVLRYRSGRFGLMNEGSDDSIVVNKFPLKKGDQVVLSTGDRVEMGTTTFRFLERRVVDLLQGFQVAVESGVDLDQDKAYPFFKQRLLIGRGKQCDIRLNDLEVSRIHVALVHRDGKFFIQHRSETNPTFLNGVSLLQGGERMIKPGDRIRLSSITLIQFEYSESRRGPIGTPRVP